VRNISHKHVKFEKYVDISQKQANNIVTYQFKNVYIKDRIQLIGILNISQKATKYISKRNEAGASETNDKVAKRKNNTAERRIGVDIDT
jgi:hypothetical protein